MSNHMPYFFLILDDKSVAFFSHSGIIKSSSVLLAGQGFY